MPTHRMYCTAEEAKNTPNATAFARECLQSRKTTFGRPNIWLDRYIRGARFEEDKAFGPVLVIEWQSKNDNDEEETD